MSRRHYEKPPVIEALVDIHATFSEPIEIGRTGVLGADDSARYPRRQELHAMALTINIAEGGAVASVQTLVGYRFSSAVGDKVVQVRNNGFAISKLPPYDSWEATRDEALRLWAWYRGTFRPDRVTRLAVRYVNRIDLPEQRGQLEDFFLVRPEVAESIHFPIETFVMQVRMPIEGTHGGVVALTQGTVPIVSGTATFGMMLDIDVSQTTEIDPRDDRTVAEALEALHAHENDVFEGCITERTRGLFK